MSSKLSKVVVKAGVSGKAARSRQGVSGKVWLDAGVRRVYESNEDKEYHSLEAEVTLAVTGDYVFDTSTGLWAVPALGSAGDVVPNPAEDFEGAGVPAGASPVALRVEVVSGAVQVEWLAGSSQLIGLEEGQEVFFFGSNAEILGSSGELTLSTQVAGAAVKVSLVLVDQI